MTNKKAEAPGPSHMPELRLMARRPDRDPVTYRAVWQQRRVRFLLDDGRVIDVLTHADNGFLRQAVVELTKGKVIGSTDVTEVTEEG